MFSVGIFSIVNTARLSLQVGLHYGKNQENKGLSGVVSAAMIMFTEIIKPSDSIHQTSL